jgi:hypothetical protein
MFEDKRGPIEHYSWGRFVVCGEEHGKVSGKKVGRGKDIRIIGREVSKWKEREGHLLAPSMITGVFEQGIEVLILGTGANGLVECPDEVVRKIEDRGVEVVLRNTPEACALYNELYHAGRRVALLAHGTC